MIPQLIAGGAAVLNGVGSAISKIQANHTYKNALSALNNQQKKVDDLFNQNYYQDYMNRSDVQGLLGNLRNNFEQQNQANMATMGTNNSIEALAAMSRNQAMGMGQAMGNIVSQMDTQKDQMMNNYMNTSTQLMGMQNNLHATRMNLLNQSGNNSNNQMGYLLEGLLR